MQQYHTLLREILEKGVSKEDRTGTGTYSIFGYQTRFDLSKDFPLLTTKRVHFKSVVHELLWFLKGDTNIKYLQDNGISIWNEWADSNGALGPTYGVQWRKWKAFHQQADGSINSNVVDQVAQVIDTIRKDPNSRRLVVSAWNVADLDSMALSPCHTLFQFYVSNNKLSCQMYQRSADAFLGVPFNIASYALLTHLIAQVCDLEVGEYIHTFGDLHLYKNHINQAITQLSREPRPLPKIEINPSIKNIDDFKYEDIKLINYDPHPAIKADVAV